MIYRHDILEIGNKMPDELAIVCSCARHGLHCEIWLALARLAQ